MKFKFYDKVVKDKGFVKWENEKFRVYVGVDVVDWGMEFEFDQDEGEEIRQDGEDG